MNAENAVFPIITFNPTTKEWKCLGTGFFINEIGGFVTARHVFIDEEGNHEKTLYGVQTTINGENHLRPLQFIVNHEFADISVGFLGLRRHSNGLNSKPDESPFFQLSQSSLNIGDEIKTFAYPESKSVENSNGNSYDLEFNGTWTNGKIIELHEKGFGLLKNKCYQTNMEVKGGASGGPVLRNGLIVGVNSTSYDFGDTSSEPISFITPIELIYNLEIPIKNGMITIEELINKGEIIRK